MRYQSPEGNKYNGMKTASQWVGKKVMTTLDVQNEAAFVPKGTTGIIENLTGNGRLVLAIDTQHCCRIKLKVPVCYHGVRIFTGSAIDLHKHETQQ